MKLIILISFVSLYLFSWWLFFSVKYLNNFGQRFVSQLVRKWKNNYAKFGSYSVLICNVWCFLYLILLCFFLISVSFHHIFWIKLDLRDCGKNYSTVIDKNRNTETKVRVKKQRSCVIDQVSDHFNGDQTVIVTSWFIDFIISEIM